MNLETIRLFAISKLGWIKRQQRRQCVQECETPRECIEHESHYIWGRRYLLRVVENVSRNYVQIDHRKIELGVTKPADTSKRRRVLDSWYRDELREAASPLIDKWQRKLKVELYLFFIQQMKTKWRSSNNQQRTIRLNLEPDKKDIEYLDYIILHEMTNFLVADNGGRFITILDTNMPNWRHVKKHLNELPLGYFDSSDISTLE